MTELDADTEIEYRVKAGLPIQLVDLRIVDEQMHDVPHDGKATGEVVVRAPWLTQGYLNDPANSEDLWRDGYLHTKDIGTIDSEGYLLVTDRIKDVIKSGGEWISSSGVRLAAKDRAVAIGRGRGRDWVAFCTGSRSGAPLRLWTIQN